MSTLLVAPAAASTHANIARTHAAITSTWPSNLFEPLA
jgi:hypothetical protein